jgi:U3 small nucleolar RNA-associated protein 4
MAFSPDSRLFSVADLAGFIDTWVLRGPGEGANGTSGEDDDDAASESSDDSSDEETDNVAGERWIRNPNAKLLPKLSAAPVLLSFAKTQRDDGDYDLMTITAVKTLLVFNPLRGALSEWSRRNTYPKLPAQFRDTRDQVKGAVWQGHRAWIYGVSSLFMLDLSQDFDLEEKKDSSSEDKNGPKHGTKRKRGVQEGGAGGKMDKQSLAPQRLKTALGPDGARWEDVEMADADADDQKSVGASSGVDDDDDDDADDTDGGELQRLRDDRGANGHGDAEGEEGSGSKAPPKWWHSYQFRPILGIVPVEGVPGLTNGVAAAGPEGLPPLEVALVERPLTGEDLPERYFAEGEWER